MTVCRALEDFEKTGQEDEILSKEGCLRFEVSDGYSALWPRASAFAPLEEPTFHYLEARKVRLKEGKKG